MLDILYQDEYLIAINKPCGLLVHRTSIAEENEVFALQLLRDQVGRKLFPVHRIDRPTSGVLVFAFSPEVARSLNDQLTNGESHKKYVALVRGWFPEEMICERQVKNDRGNLQDAITRFVPLKQLELPLATDRYPTARFSVVEAYPLTGRWHQIRQHLAQLRHYIINDRVHGDGKQNRIFTEQLDIREMFLHARSLRLQHPELSSELTIEASFPSHWNNFL
ncbi:pseudouridine synthase [Paludibacter sp.]|uniref:pseudouridine synthase n=1 Tax=Paludibacter sp. TaxID=1898105 RepID=UPI001354D43D|nr:pseudouridine synthase [Paludibacter sp.]MTK52251.1 pseudouridylate synthase [Paludibacter sp.]